MSNSVEKITRFKLCQDGEGGCPVLEVNHRTNKVIITDDDGGKVTLTKEQWDLAIAKAPTIK